MKPYQIEWKNKILGRRSINLDISNLCTLECPRCDRQKRPRPVPGRNMTVDEFAVIAKHFDDILLCGQISDPIFNPNLFEFMEIAKAENVWLSIASAASQRPVNWWNKAFDTLGPRSYWTFGLDGLPKDSHKYRINQDGEFLWEMMKIGKSKGHDIRWQYIVFKYNENDIETCRKMASDHGIHFIEMHSGRFKKEDDPYKPSPEFRVKR